jgi:hypothetical protein
MECPEIMQVHDVPGIVPSGPTVTPAKIPPLEPGDHLSRDEFERRYHAMPGLKKVELLSPEHAAFVDQLGRASGRL